MGEVGEGQGGEGGELRQGEIQQHIQAFTYTDHIKVFDRHTEVGVLLAVLDDCGGQDMASALNVDTWPVYLLKVDPLDVAHSPEQNLRKLFC